MARKDVSVAGAAAQAAEAHSRTKTKMRNSLFIEQESSGTYAVSGQAAKRQPGGNENQQIRSSPLPILQTYLSGRNAPFCVDRLPIPRERIWSQSRQLLPSRIPDVIALHPWASTDPPGFPLCFLAYMAASEALRRLFLVAPSSG
jgi:hypothetical protein